MAEHVDYFVCLYFAADRRRARPAGCVRFVCCRCRFGRRRRYVTWVVV